MVFNFFFYFTADQRGGRKGWVEEGKGERGNGDIYYSVNNKVNKTGTQGWI